MSDPYLHAEPWAGKYKLAVSSHACRSRVERILGDGLGFHSGMVKNAKGVAYITQAQWELVREVSGVRRIRPEVNRVKRLSKRAVAFRNGFVAYLEQSGARLIRTGESRFASHDLKIETVCGELSISIYDEWIACCFKDVEAACKVLNPTRYLGGAINPYSGKWNFHFDREMSLVNRLRLFEGELRKVLKAEKAEAAT